MILSQLLASITSDYALLGSTAIDQIEVSDITIDSRQVKAGSIFFALAGSTTNGAQFIDDAIAKGAVAVVSSQFMGDIPNHIAAIQTTQPAKILESALKAFYAPLPNNICAVTGTNGKTSVAEFARQIFTLLGQKAASIGTLGVICDDIHPNALQFSPLTTPDIVSIYKNLYALKKADVDNVIIEASSIGLEQGRLNGLDIAVVAFTNFTQDHIDYHGSMEEYFRCKMILFNDVMADDATAILNRDIDEFNQMRQIFLQKGGNIIEYGTKANDLALKEIALSENGQKVAFDFNDQHYQFNLAIEGEFQAFNVMCALGVVLAKNKLEHNALQVLIAKFDQLRSALGRMQHVATLPNQAQIFIDFAHTPDALRNVLQLARKLTDARLVILFGCGGDRDPKKRVLMGQIACELADLVIVTDDNPRTENPENIRHEIISGCANTDIIEIANRKTAIKDAIPMLQPADILILAGKGHEKYQIIGRDKHDFDEELIVKNAIKTQ